MKVGNKNTEVAAGDSLSSLPVSRTTSPIYNRRPLCRMALSHTKAPTGYSSSSICLRFCHVVAITFESLFAPTAFQHWIAWWAGVVPISFVSPPTKDSALRRRGRLQLRANFILSADLNICIVHTGPKVGTEIRDRKRERYPARGD